MFIYRARFFVDGDDIYYAVVCVIYDNSFLLEYLNWFLVGWYTIAQPTFMEG